MRVIVCECVSVVMSMNKNSAVYGRSNEMIDSKVHQTLEKSHLDSNNNDEEYKKMNS